MNCLSEQTARGALGDWAARVEYRAACDQDQHFLFELYSSTRSSEIAAFGWSADQEKAFLELQFRARERHYEVQALDVDRRIVLVDGSPVGEIIVMRSQREIRLGDISLLPAWRCKGIGSYLIGDLFAEATDRRLPVTLHVEKTNPSAAALYLKLGFKTTGDTGSHFKMEWSPVDGHA